MEFEEKVKKVEHVFDGKIIDLDIETIELPMVKKPNEKLSVIKVRLLLLQLLTKIKWYSSNNGEHL